MAWKTFTRKELIGSSSFSDVFKVINKAEEVIALKVIHKEFYSDRLQFKSAFEAARKIDDPNCLKMYDWISDEDVSWTMEFVDGESLSALKFTDRNSLDQILKIMIKVCNGLITLHSRNIIHRDLKPENILIDSGGVVKITDFDFIKTGFSEKKLGKFIGTPEYASPEHFISSYELDTRSDLYSLGIILYELLTAKRPFTGKTAKEIGDQHRIKPLVLPTKINQAIPNRIEKIVLGLLEKDPKDRYQHAHAVARDLWKELSGKKGIKLQKDVSYLLKPKFVNRTTPLRKLHKLSDELKEQTGNVVLILGESGIGKTKLIQQFYYQLQLHDISFYRSICKTVESAFNPLFKIFEEIISNKTETEKLNYFGDFGWDLVKAGILTEQCWMKKVKKPIELSGQNAEIRLFGAITDFLKKAAFKPLVICIDDLHWADEQILKWLKYAERNLQDHPILIIGLHRSEMMFEDSFLLKIENLIQIKIKNLKDLDVADMIKSMLGIKRRNKAMIDFTKSIVSHTKGNPLFIREMLYHLNEQEKITIVNNRWEFPPKLEVEKLPDTIQEVIQNRLEELSSSARKTLQIASVIGKKFSFELLKHLTQKSESQLIEDLIDCREVSLLDESENAYAFIHDKIREVLEDELKIKHLENWKKLHLKAGKYLEEKFSEKIDEVLDELADHFYKAVDEKKSIKYLELAGDKARKNFQNEKALKYYYNYINISKDLKYTHAKFLILYRVGNILIHLGKWETALKHYETCAQIKSLQMDSDAMAATYERTGWLNHLQYKNKQALQYFDKAMKLYDKHDTKNIGLIYEHKGLVFSDMELYKKSILLLKKNLEIQLQYGNKVLISRAYQNLAIPYEQIGDYKMALSCFRKSLKLAKEIGEESRIAGCMLNAGFMQKLMGDFDTAFGIIKKAYNSFVETGHLRAKVLAMGELGDLLRGYGRLDEAMNIIQESIKIRKEIGFMRSVPESLHYITKILIELKKFEKAKTNNNECSIYAHEFDSKYIFICSLYSTIIEFNLMKHKDLEKIKCIQSLEKMLQKFKKNNEVALINYELALMYYELENFKKMESYKKRAIELLKQVYNSTPNIEYKLKYEKLLQIS